LHMRSRGNYELWGLILSWFHTVQISYRVRMRVLVFVYLFDKCDRLCALEVRVPGYRTEMCVSCEVRTEFLYVM
jgi:hypothetical protein